MRLVSNGHGSFDGKRLLCRHGRWQQSLLERLYDYGVGGWLLSALGLGLFLLDQQAFECAEPLC